jgi:hypothetical protein
MHTFAKVGDIFSLQLNFQVIQAASTRLKNEIPKYLI